MAIANAYLQKVYADVEKRNPGESEFLQAVREVLESLSPVADRRPDLIVQCTSVGHGASDPSADPIPGYAFDGHEAVYDLVYQPAVTPVLARARAAGCRIESGMTMLRAQAEIQHRLWFSPPSGH